MSTTPTVLAMILARGGSKGLPRKNVLLVDGRPLIAWTVAAALGAKCVSRVILSSDDDEIILAARANGCEVPFRRPAELATDQATSIEVVLHALAEIPGYDYLLLLQPTSPLRTAADIDAAFAAMMASAAPACVSLCPVEESPYWMFRVDAENRMAKLLEPPPSAHRRQELPPVYSLNGALYLARTDWFYRNKTFISPETIGYVMPRSRSIDIDTREDFMAFQRAIAGRATANVSSPPTDAPYTHTDDHIDTPP
ncbi:MAG: N-acylneuraminate cytidylyltransferase [Candidatus Accumulibacter regalis]|jgi:CMP-N,N'-diacetyllegionaminic acid synthase|uniref:acylneuraminate cytidylyltransferase family protein n=1 Tax=unclassified Candidatus Accumulibacter TaxID=2619054 RepID=UPI001A5DD3E1|nr:MULTISPECIES: acylneuraminate cytidylyltransferase family protein [unclassified Candidatus Accumulibacter]MBL8511368.1 acylneuraminate cytidylyltransferase family protein [Betaproteobacteria bacterium]HRE72570.1 acylneuraminate cytidylyltransferase family protein [Accumulibacter sp.]